MTTVKRELGAMVKNLSQEATWDDVLYEIYIRQKIAKGLDAVKEQRTLSHDAVKRLLVHC